MRRVGARCSFIQQLTMSLQQYPMIYPHIYAYMMYVCVWVSVLEPKNISPLSVTEFCNVHVSYWPGHWSLAEHTIQCRQNSLVNHRRRPAYKDHTILGSREQMLLHHVFIHQTLETVPGIIFWRVFQNMNNVHAAISAFHKRLELVLHENIFAGFITVEDPQLGLIFGAQSDAACD